MLRFILWPVMRYTRYVIWTIAIAASGATYAFLSTREEIPGLAGLTQDGGPYVIAFWEPYVWTAVAFIGTKIVLRALLRRFLNAAHAQIARVRSGVVIGPER